MSLGALRLEATLAITILTELSGIQAFEFIIIAILVPGLSLRSLKYTTFSVLTLAIIIVASAH